MALAVITSCAEGIYAEKAGLDSGMRFLQRRKQYHQIVNNVVNVDAIAD